MEVLSTTTTSAHSLYLPNISFSRNLLDKTRLPIDLNSHRRSISFLLRVPLARMSVRAMAAVQTEKRTSRSSSSTIEKPPTKDKTPKLDDGGTGFPPRGGGGWGGGGGGGWGKSSGGFYLFSFLIFMNYLKELDGDDSSGRGGDINW